MYVCNQLLRLATVACILVGSSVQCWHILQIQHGDVVPTKVSAVQLAIVFSDGGDKGDVTCRVVQ